MRSLRATEACIVQMAMSPPPAGRSRWTTRLLGKQVGLTAGCVSDVLRRNGLKPHLVRTYKVSRDPDFAAKVKDVVGLYLNPPEHAVVLSVDEKTSIQALERTQLPLPLRSGRATRHTHDYKRALREHLRAYMRAWNRNPTTFAWTKPAAAITASHRRMLKRISTTVH
jgi:hypothetical protein